MTESKEHERRLPAPLLEFDPDPLAMIEPSSHYGGTAAVQVDMPHVVVACFFGDAVARLAAERQARQVAELATEHGHHPVWALRHAGHEIGFYQPGLGAPLAAALLEEVIDYGATTVVAVGGCGALEPGLALGHVVVVAEALRDEGTSYHYLAPARTVMAEPAVVAELEALLCERDLPFSTGRSWTTDGLYRETRKKVAARRREGCLVVEMEAAALLAVARFRGIRLGQLLYAGDTLAGDEWDHRGWMHAHDVREEMFWLATDAAVRLARSAPGELPAQPG